MATLQKLRNKGPLLVIFVGLALFAFIAGDAVKLFETNSIETSVGTVGEQEIEAMEYQQVYNELDAFCKVSGIELPEEDKKTVIWELLSNSAIYNNYAEEIGYTVTPEELNHVLTNGKSNFVNSTVHPSSPFRGGASFNMEFLAEVLKVYEEQTSTGQLDPNVATFYNCWKYMEREIVLEITRNKVNSIVANATIANPAVAQKNFDLNNNTYTLDVALYPYNKINRDSINVSDAEIAAYQKKNKNNPVFTNNEETRDIRYILAVVRPSAEDLAAIKKDMQSYADTLKAGYNNYSKLVRFSRSIAPFNNLLLPKSLLDQTIISHIENADVNEVVGPVDNAIATGNKQISTLDVYMNIEKAEIPETITLRAINFSDTDKAVADSLLNILNNGADFKAVVSNYENVFDSLTINTSNANDIMGLFDDIESQKDIYNAPVGKYIITDINVRGYNGKLLFQVMDKKGTTTAYNTLVIRREKAFSNETYNETYDQFCKFVGSCNNLKEFEEKYTAEANNNFAFFPEKMVTTGATRIARVPKTADFIDWIFNENTQIGQISDIRKCGEDDCFMAVVLENVNAKGERNIDSEIAVGYTIKDFVTNEIKNEKAVEFAIAEMKDKAFDALKSNSNISTYTVDQVEFSKPTNVSSTLSDEANISAVAATLNVGETSAPFKGENGVYVIKATAKNAKNATFNATAEKQNIESPLNANYSVSALQSALSKLYPKENKVYKHF